MDDSVMSPLAPVLLGASPTNRQRGFRRQIIATPPSSCWTLQQSARVRQRCQHQGESHWKSRPHGLNPLARTLPN